MLRFGFLLALIIMNKVNFLNGKESIKINGPNSAEIEYEEGDDGSMSKELADADDDSAGSEEIDENGSYIGFPMAEGEEIAANPLDSDDAEVPDIPDESVGGDVEDLKSDQGSDGGEESGEVIDPYANSGYPDLSDRFVNFGDSTAEEADEQYAPQSPHISQTTLPKKNRPKINSKRFEDRYPELYRSIIAKETKARQTKAMKNVRPGQQTVTNEGDLFAQPLEQLYQSYKADQARQFRDMPRKVELKKDLDAFIDQNNKVTANSPAPEAVSVNAGSASRSYAPTNPLTVSVNSGSVPTNFDATQALAEPIDKQHMSSQIQFLKKGDNSSLPRVDTKGVIIKPMPEEGNKSWTARSGVIESGKTGGRVLVPKRERRILARYKVIIPVIVPNLRVKMPHKNATEPLIVH